MTDFEEVVRALCYIGAGAHSKDPSNQLLIAQSVYYAWVQHGDEGFTPEAALIDFLAKTMGVDLSKMKKAPPDRLRD